MACLEINYNNKLIRIKNNENSELNNNSEFSILFNFLTKGILPENTIIEGDIDINKDELFDYLLNKMINDPDNNELLRSLLPNLNNYENFVNKLIGNNSLKNYTEYVYNEFDHDVLINSSWGQSKNWYGFTDKRMILISGSKSNISSNKTNILAQAYNNIKLGEKWTINVINNLSSKYLLNNEWNIYKKLTWLANNSDELVSILNLKYQKSVDMKRISKDDIIGLYFRDKSQTYFISGFSKSDPNSIEIINIENNDKQDFKISNIKKLYSSISIDRLGKTYTLINENWYELNKNKIKKVNDELSISLSNEYLSISNNDNIIDTYNDNINGNTQINDTNIKDILPDGTKIRTASNIYIKQNGIFEGLSDNEKWYNIIYDKNIDIINVLKNKNINIKEQILSPSDMRIILYDLFNVGNNSISFEDILFTYKKNAPAVQVLSKRIISNNIISNKPYIRISSNFINNIDNILLLQLALSTVNYINSNQNKNPNLINNIGQLWENINNALVDKKYDMVDDIKNIFNNINNQITTDTINNILEDNINSMSKNINVDELMKDLINKGILIISCKI